MNWRINCAIFICNEKLFHISVFKYVMFGFFSKSYLMFLFIDRRLIETSQSLMVSTQD